MFSLLITVFCVGLAAVGCLYSVAAALAVRSFGQARSPHGGSPTAGVTVLKPLRGAEAGLYENLLTFLQQDYAGPVQIVFGVTDPLDPAQAIVRALMDAHPDRDIALVVAPRDMTGNRKIGNLAAMASVIAHDVVVLSDSDIAVDAHYLNEVCAPLADPEVGLVTCVYRGNAGPGLWSALSTMAIDFHFFPSVLLGVRLANARPCMGATMAFTRDTLERIGGFAAFASHLADDYAIGAAVRATGRRVVLAPCTVRHRCNERSAAELVLHELRWARTIRSIDPAGFAGSLVTHPLPFAVLAVATGGAPLAAASCLVATLVCRALLQWQVERCFGQRTRRWLLGPVRDALSFAVFAASFTTDVVVWRGRRYRVRSDGTMQELTGRATRRAGATAARLPFRRKRYPAN